MSVEKTRKSRVGRGLPPWRRDMELGIMKGEDGVQRVSAAIKLVREGKGGGGVQKKKKTFPSAGGA